MKVDIQTCSLTNNFVLGTDGAVTIKDVELSKPYVFFNKCRFLDNEEVLVEPLLLDLLNLPYHLYSLLYETIVHFTDTFL